MELNKKVTTRNTRKRALLAAILSKMVKNTFFTVLFQDDMDLTPKEVNGRMNAGYAGPYVLMDEYLMILKRDQSYEVIPVDRILGIKHNGIITTINGNSCSKYDQTVLTYKLR